MTAVPGEIPIAAPSFRERLAATSRIAAATAVALAGIDTVASAVTPNVPWRDGVLLAVEPGAAIALGHVLAAAGGVGLTVLGLALARRRRRAADAAIAVLVAVAVLHLAKGLDYEEAALAAGLALLLVLGRRDCRDGRPPRAGVVLGLIAVGALAAGFALETSVQLLAPGDPGLPVALARAGHALGAGEWWLRSGEPAAIVLDALVLVALAAALAWAQALLRPAPGSDGHSEEEHRRATRIIEEHGEDSLAPFALRADKSLFLSRGGVLAYRTVRETAVVSGDPIGPPGTAGPIVADFLAYAAARGWDVALTAVGSRHLPEYARLGLRPRAIGQEAVVDPAAFSLEGRRIRKVRQSVARVQRHGWTVEVVDAAQLEPGAVSELVAVERAWCARRRRLTGFAMTLGRLAAGAPEDAGVFVLARDAEGRLRAFMGFLAYRRGLSLDAMRRLGGEPNGLNEAMVVALLDHARARGVPEVSLNFAGFGHLMADEGALTPRQRLLRAVLRHAHGRVQLERLVRFNQKFLPAWRPRYLVHRGAATLPRAALRVLQAEAYVRPPRARPRRPRWEPPALPAPSAPTATRPLVTSR